MRTPSRHLAKLLIIALALTPFTLLSAQEAAGDDELTGTLISYGLSQEDADFFSQELTEDSILVLVLVDVDTHDAAFEIMRHARGVVRA